MLKSVYILYEVIVNIVKKNNNNLTDEEKKKIIDLFNAGYNTVYIANELNRASSSVQRFLKKTGYEIKMNRLNVTKLEEKEICNLYMAGYSTEAISEMYNPKIKSGNTISKILKRNGIELRPAKRVVVINNEDFFQRIDSEEKAYLLGLFITDGYVKEDYRGNRSKLVGITLSVKDEYMIKKIKDLLGIKSRKLYYSREEVTVECSSNKLAEDLSKYGVVIRKTFKTYIPNIDANLIKHLLRGILDGDGIVSDNTNAFYCGICGTEMLVNQFKNICVEQLGIKNNKVTFNKTNNIYYWSFSSKKDICKFYRYIYEDATIFLLRKKEKFDKFYSENIEKFENI